MNERLICKVRAKDKLDCENAHWINPPEKRLPLKLSIRLRTSNSHTLFQSEIEQRFTGDLHLTTLGDDLRTVAHSGACSSSDCRPLPTAAPPMVLLAVLAPFDLPVNS